MLCQELQTLATLSTPARNYQQAHCYGDARNKRAPGQVIVKHLALPGKGHTWAFVVGCRRGGSGVAGGVAAGRGERGEGVRGGGGRGSGGTGGRGAGEGRGDEGADGGGAEEHGGGEALWGAKAGVSDGGAITGA